jgi:cell volume regulation protein A
VDEHLNLLLLLSFVLLLVAVLAVRVSARTGLPSLLLYLAIGLAVGEAGLGLQFEDYELTLDLGYIALAVILAEGGLTTRWQTVRPALPLAIALSTIGVLASVAVIAAVGHLLLGLELRTAVVLGGVLASTDAAAVFSVLRKLPLNGRIRAVLEAESGLNDAPVVVLVALASSDAWGSTGVLELIAVVLYELLAGAVIGLVVGRVGRSLLSRVALPSAGLYPVATVGLVLLAFTIGNALHASGFLAVYLAGLVFGNAALPHRRAVLGFAGSLALLAEVGLFVLLGLLVSPGRLPGAVGLALVIGAAATFVARPLGVALSSLPFRLPWRQQVFLSWAGLRGAVPIVLTTIPVTEGLPGAERIVDVVFVLVVVYTLLQAPTLPLAGRLLGVVERGQIGELEVETAPLEQMGADLLQLVVPEGSRLHGVYVEELRLPPGAQVTLVVRQGRSLVPQPTTQLAAGDQLLVVATSAVRSATEERLRAVARAGKLARWYGESGPPPVSR